MTWQDKSFGLAVHAIAAFLFSFLPALPAHHVSIAVGHGPSAYSFGHSILPAGAHDRVIQTCYRTTIHEGIPCF